MAKSHPTYDLTYDQYGKKRGTIQTRMQEMEFVDPKSEEGIEQAEIFAEEHGRSWWIFQGTTFRHNRKRKTWIEQYYVEDPNRPRGVGIRKKVGRPRKDV
jgi:hypothetical protein